MTIETVMAVTSGLSHLTRLALETTNNITDSWYQASEDREEFKRMQSKLERKSEIWTDALRNAGMSHKRLIKEPLDEAIRSLEEEKKKIDRIQSSCCLSLLSRFRTQPFPALLKDSMGKVMDAFDNIPHDFIESIEPTRILESIADSSPDLHQIIVDRRIVELAETLNEVVKHLNDRTGTQVVTLYGGTGSGKTSLAKSVAKYYEENKTIFAEGAWFLSCGHNATVDSICKELLESLGYDMNTESASDAKSEQAFKSKGTPSEGPTSSAALVKRLQRRLRERHLLIILDDVSDPKLLEEILIVPSARDVKYLITTQQRDIWDGATVVHMLPPTDEEAMKILGNYVPNLLNGHIPDDFQDIATQIIEKAYKHPMTLATVGRQIKDFNDKSTWDDVLHDFNELLSSRQAYEDTGSRLSISMLMAVDALGSHSDAQKLLYLIAMCEPLYVPEVLLLFLFKYIDPKHTDLKHRQIALNRHVKNLKDRDLIVEQVVSQKKELGVSNAYQHFILKNKTQDVSELLCSLMKVDDDDDNDNDDMLLVRVLCVLYIYSKEGTFTSTAALALEKTARFFNIPLEDQDMIFNMRQAIESLIYLLFPFKEGKECQRRRHRLVSKVIMQFISKQDLDDESCSQLLEEMDIYESVCEVLVKMSNTQKTKSILTKDTTLTLEELWFNLTPKSEQIVTTLDTLSSLTKDTNCDLILDDDCVLKNLLEILCSGNQSEKLSTLMFLSVLAQSPTAREKIASCEELIKVLVCIFNADSDITILDNMMEKVYAVDALGCIGFHEKISVKLVRTPGFLTGIVQFLKDNYYKEKDLILRNGILYAVQCLMYLLKANEDNHGNIKKHDDLVHVLSEILQTYNASKDCFNKNISTSADLAQAAIQILTFLDPERYNKVILYSELAYCSRGDSNACRGLYKQALEDYKRADRLDNYNDGFYKMKLCFLKAMLKDYKGALLYANRAIEAEPNEQFVWQESGVLKELMGNYEGAKKDLNKSLSLLPDDYETLKHRAYVNFMLGCEEEAHEDAKKAQHIIPEYRIYAPDYGRDNFLGSLPIPKFLGYYLK